MKASEPPRAHRRFFKAHGLGNDYLVVDAGDEWTLSSDAVRRVCHRTRGVGADGIVWVAGGDSPFVARMFNPDGSEFERSGNGLRVLAAFLHTMGRVGDAPFTVEVGGDRVGMHVLGADCGEWDIVADMGRVTVREEERLPLEDGELSFVRASVGNPHAVVWGAPAPWKAPPGLDVLRRVGPRLTNHETFPEGTNVQLASVESQRRIRALVWERGVGHTTASGTSACAVAASAVATGRVPAGEIEVTMEGGSLFVRVAESLEVRLRGPVRAVMRGEVADAVVAS